MHDPTQRERDEDGLAARDPADLSGHQLGRVATVSPWLASWSVAIVCVAEIFCGQQLIERVSQQAPERRIIRPACGYSAINLRQWAFPRTKHSVDTGPSDGWPNPYLIQIATSIAKIDWMCRIKDQDEAIATPPTIDWILDEFAFLMREVLFMPASAGRQELRHLLVPEGQKMDFRVLRFASHLWSRTTPTLVHTLTIGSETHL